MLTLETARRTSTALLLEKVYIHQGYVEGNGEAPFRGHVQERGRANFNKENLERIFKITRIKPSPKDLEAHSFI